VEHVFGRFFVASSSSDRVDSGGPLRQPPVNILISDMFDLMTLKMWYVLYSVLHTMIFFKSLKLIDHYIFNILAINMLRRLVIFRYFDAERDSEREGEV